MVELKLAEQKIWWGPMVEQKMVGTLSHWVAGGTPGTRAKGSAEQKMAKLILVEQKIGGGPLAIGWWGPLVQVQKGQWNKKCGTKNCRTKIWWGPSRSLSASVKRSAEQKCGTKIVEQKLVVTLRHFVLGTPSASVKRSAEQKCGTKIAEQKLVGLLDIGC